ncbi:MAG: outer membrane beta-barrel protein [Verrucomicrobiales bacterium]
MNKIAVSLAAVLVSPLVAQAQDAFDGPALSYTYLEGGYERRFFDDGDLSDANGFGAGFSVAPLPFLFLTGELHYASPTVSILDSEEDVDFLDARLGAGLNVTILDTLSIYVEGGPAYRQLSSDAWERVSDATMDDVGFYVEPGVRIGIAGRLELYAAGDFSRISDEDILGAKAGLILGLTDNFALTAGATANEQTSSVGVGIRLAW